MLGYLGKFRLLPATFIWKCCKKTMSNPPRIWLDYLPVRIGWVIPIQDIARLVTIATWNSCLWGGRHNYVIPAHDTALADRLVACSGVDVLLPVQPDAATTAFIERYPHLEHHRWRASIFQQRGCEFADIRHGFAPDHCASG
jgi:hypothetical protein